LKKNKSEEIFIEIPKEEKELKKETGEDFLLKISKGKLSIREWYSAIEIFGVLK
jgi:hypothetical protein